MHVTISHGLCNLLRKEFPDGTTVGSVLADPDVKEQFGDTENMAGRVQGKLKSGDDALLDGDVLIISNEACEKSAGVRLQGGDPYQFYFKQIEPLAGEPAHIHVWRDGNEAKFWLEPLEHVYSRGFAPHEVNDIIRRIKRGNNLETLVNAWKDVHQRFASQDTPAHQRR